MAQDGDAHGCSGSLLSRVVFVYVVLGWGRLGGWGLREVKFSQEHSRAAAVKAKTMVAVAGRSRVAVTFYRVHTDLFTCLSRGTTHWWASKSAPLPTQPSGQNTELSSQFGLQSAKDKYAVTL